MSGYDLFVPYISREELEERACAWRYCFGVQDRWAPDLARLLEHELPKVMPKFALRIQDEMPDNDEGRTWHSVPAIDLRADVYDALCQVNHERASPPHMSLRILFYTRANLGRGR